MVTGIAPTYCTVLKFVLVNIMSRYIQKNSGTGKLHTTTGTKKLQLGNLSSTPDSVPCSYCETPGTPYQIGVTFSGVEICGDCCYIGMGGGWFLYRTQVWEVNPNGVEIIVDQNPLNGCYWSKSAAASIRYSLYKEWVGYDPCTFFLWDAIIEQPLQVSRLSATEMSVRLGNFGPGWGGIFSNVSITVEAPLLNCLKCTDAPNYTDPCYTNLCNYGPDGRAGIVTVRDV